MIFKKNAIIETSAAGTPDSEIHYLQFPRLRAYGQIKHAIFTRQGGVSPEPFNTLNCSFGTEDRPENIEANLRIIANHFRVNNLFFLNQVHGCEIVTIRKKDRDLFPRSAVQADAMLTDQAGIGLLIKQADCQAVILYDPHKGVIGNVHCGWRGNRQNILAAVVARMQMDFNCRAADITAAIGPSLGPCCAEFRTYPEIFPPDFRPLMVREHYFNLWEISRRQLLQAGLEEQNIELAGLCTRCRTDLFYSYRAEGVTGRFATVVMLEG